MRVFLLALLITVVSCDRSSDDGFTLHCDNLVNEPRDASDNAQIFIPKAFTPNGDGLNDGFRPVVFNVSSVSVKIYDEDGQLVFETQQINGVWSPGILPSQFELFYYRVEGFTMQNKKFGYCGSVYALNCLPRNINVMWTYEDQITPNGFTGITAETLTQCN